MQKICFIFLLILSPFLLLAQSRTQIKLETAERATGDLKVKKATYLRKPVFSHDGAILTCDSAVLYQERNFFEAFGNVHINQGDTLNIYSEFLNYDGNAKKAHLDKNVKLIDRENTLTSNVLDYDMVAKIGEYKNGGQLTNKDATITSKSGFYFSNSRDAYFKVDVLVVTPESTITSENLRYNTLTNWTYFYGPTNIKGKEDNLYTENGAYNTKTENALFGKKNLYTNGSRSLKGDSLYYYGKRGYGRAVKNITFRDTKDQTLLRGQLGQYYRADERVVVTEKAYVGIGTKDSVMVKDRKMPDTLWLGADTLETQQVLVKTLNLLPKPIVKKDNEIGTEDEKEKAAKEKEKAEARKALQQTEGVEPPQKDNKTIVKSNKKLSKKERKLLAKQVAEPNLENPLPIALDSIANAKKALKRDSVVADSLFRLTKIMPSAKKELGTNKVEVSKTSAAAKDKVSTKLIENTKLLKDTVPSSPADTTRARVIKAFHNVRVYKSNMQAKADSLFYSAADSTLRWYKDPILWADGTQQTGDTIHVFFKNSKIHNFQVLNNGFIVNVQGDSTKFNQVKGKVITGFFKDGELRNMYVDGNAESIYFSKNDNDQYENVNQTVSNRLRFKFNNKELTDIVTVREVEGAVDPIDKLTKESLLTGFIWKPELRPLSKADIIKGPTIKKAATKAAVKSQESNKKSATPAIPKKAIPKSKSIPPAAKSTEKMVAPVAN